MFRQYEAAKGWGLTFVTNLSLYSSFSQASNAGRCSKSSFTPSHALWLSILSTQLHEENGGESPSANGRSGVYHIPLVGLLGAVSHSWGSGAGVLPPTLCIFVTRIAQPLVHLLTSLPDQKHHL